VHFNKYYYRDQIKDNEIGRACMGKMRNAYKLLVRKLGDHSEDLGADGKILEWIMGK
jgi:hypothetical protein